MVSCPRQVRMMKINGGRKSRWTFSWNKLIWVPDYHVNMMRNILSIFAKIREFRLITTFLLTTVMHILAVSPGNFQSWFLNFYPLREGELRETADNMETGRLINGSPCCPSVFGPPKATAWSNILPPKATAWSNILPPKATVLSDLLPSIIFHLSGAAPILHHESLRYSCQLFFLSSK